MDEQQADPVAQQTPTTPPPWWHGQSWLMALVAATVTLILILVIASVAFVHPRSTATAQVPPTATPTLTALPTPTNKPGFRYYSESSADFQVQYPQTWQTVPQNPGVEIDDNTASPTYIMQVLLPTQNLDAQTDWIQYEFTNLKDSTGTTDFHQVGQRSIVSIDGAAWTSAFAQLKQANTNISVRVLVTRHLDRVYIINLLASDVTMTEAQQRFFNDMLGTFAFLS